MMVTENRLLELSSLIGSGVSYGNFISFRVAVCIFICKSSEFSTDRVGRECDCRHVRRGSLVLVNSFTTGVAYTVQSGRGDLSIHSGCPSDQILHSVSRINLMIMIMRGKELMGSLNSLF